MKTYAIISDIHGNSLALEAVLADIKSRDIETIINLGDHFFGALEPEIVSFILRENEMLCISGNTDREILESIDAGFEKDGMDRVKADLSDQSISWLRKLPKTEVLDGLFFVCHGTPESDDEYLLEKVTEKGVFMLGDIYENKLNNKDQAKIYYQKIITDYPGSLWINDARKRFRILRGDKPDAS